jgi:DNA-binding HxlR family transcriptional regulator
MPSRITKLDPGGVNAIGRMLGLLGDEWNLLILQQALMGASRYCHFIERLPVSNAVLAGRLRVLTEAGLLDRPQRPARGESAEYLPTARSRSLWPVLLCIWEWERRWVPDRAGQLPAMRHRTCGTDFAPVLRCGGCHGAISAANVDFVAGPSGDWARSAPSSSTRRRADRQTAAGQAGLFAETMSVFGNRWAAALLVAAFLDTTRFSDFQTQLGAPPSVLSERLQTFCAIGVLRTTGDGAERTAYLLTEKGRALIAVLVTALQWAQRWFRAPEGPALAPFHRGCGAGLDAELACGSCGERLRGAAVDVVAVSSPVVAGSP